MRQPANEAAAEAIEPDDRVDRHDPAKAQPDQEARSELRREASRCQRGCECFPHSVRNPKGDRKLYEEKDAAEKTATRARLQGRIGRAAMTGGWIQGERTPQDDRERNTGVSFQPTGGSW